MCGRHYEGCGHEPKGVFTYERNVDEHCDQCEESNNERNYVRAKNVEYCNHLCWPPEKLS